MKLRNVIILGTGAISAKHLTALRDNSKHFQLRGACDVDEKKGRDFADRSGCTFYLDPTTMAQECKPEVVIITTPSFLHAEHAVFWLDQGAHLILEKPVALSSRDMHAITEARDRNNRSIAVGYITRYSPHIQLVKQAIDAGRFGRIFHVGLSIYWNRSDEYFSEAAWRGTWANDGGMLMNQATHGIDLMQWFLGGNPVSVVSNVSRQVRHVEAEDFAAAVVTFEGGAVGTVQATVGTYPSNLGTRLTILGETGTVEISGKGPDAITTWRFPESEEWRDTDAKVAAGEIGTAGDQLTGHSALYRDLANAIDAGTKPLADFESACKSVEIVLGIYQSHKEGRAIEFPVSFATTDMIGVDL